jgi:hypothetical protein
MLARTGTIKSQSFLRTIVGEVRYGAGSWLTLDTKTSYSEQYPDTMGAGVEGDVHASSPPLLRERSPGDGLRR